jgi:hypothetical protein
LSTDCYSLVKKIINDALDVYVQSEINTLQHRNDLAKAMVKELLKARGTKNKERLFSDVLFPTVRERLFLKSFDRSNNDLLEFKDKSYKELPTNIAARLKHLKGLQVKVNI